MSDTYSANELRNSPRKLERHMSDDNGLAQAIAHVARELRDMLESVTPTKDRVYRFFLAHGSALLAALSVNPAAQGWLQEIESQIAERSKRFRTFDDRDEHSRYMALALAGEVGELLNIVKKHWRGDAPSIDGKALLDEASDIFIYWTLFCHVHSWPIERVIRHANEKAERKILALEASRKVPSVVSADSKGGEDA